MGTHPMAQLDLPADPCINICRMDQKAQFCRGCMRTLNEIGRWNRMSAQERIEVCRAVERRRNPSGGFDG
jgi:hypothetical protein